MTAPGARPDPFTGGTSSPSLSFKDAAPGTTYVCRVTDYPDLVQSTDFETREKAFWPDGNPKMSAVVNVEVNGQPYAVWAAKPSSLFAAIAAAQQAAGKQIEPGGILTITYTHDEPNKTNPRLNPAKQYSATYQPPSAFDAPAAAPQAAQAAPAAAPAPVPAPSAVPPAQTAAQAQQQIAAQAPAAAPAPAAKTVTAEQYAALANAGVDMTPFVVG